MDIQRYNQGFGGFGPLERCDTGKLVKHEDHEIIVKGLQLSVEALQSTIDDLDYALEERKYAAKYWMEKDERLEEKYYKELKRANHWKIRTEIACGGVIVFCALSAWLWLH